MLVVGMTVYVISNCECNINMLSIFLAKQDKSGTSQTPSNYPEMALVCFTREVEGEMHTMTSLVKASDISKIGS